MCSGGSVYALAGPDEETGRWTRWCNGPVVFHKALGTDDDGLETIGRASLSNGSSAATTTANVHPRVHFSVRYTARGTGRENK